MRPSEEQLGSRGDTGPRGLAVLRAAWACDCDGRSHRAGGTVPAAPAAAVRKHAGTVEKVTGHRPLTCPWRAMYDPLVAHTMRLAGAAQRDYATAHLGADPPAVLLDALDVFFAARGAGERHIEKQKASPPPGRGGPKKPQLPPGFISARGKRQRVRRG